MSRVVICKFVVGAYKTSQSLKIYIIFLCEAEKTHKNIDRKLGINKINQCIYDPILSARFSKRFPALIQNETSYQNSSVDRILQ